MNQAMERRVLREAEYIAATGATVRKTASVLGVSKSTVHKDMESRLAALSAPLHKEVAAVMAKNKAERHLRGGDRAAIAMAEEDEVAEAGRFEDRWKRHRGLVVQIGQPARQGRRIRAAIA